MITLSLQVHGVPLQPQACQPPLPQPFPGGAAQPDQPNLQKKLCRPAEEKVAPRPVGPSSPRVGDLDGLESSTSALRSWTRSTQSLPPEAAALGQVAVGPCWTLQGQSLSGETVGPRRTGPGQSSELIGPPHLPSARCRVQRHPFERIATPFQVYSWTAPQAEHAMDCVRAEDAYTSRLGYEEHIPGPVPVAIPGSSLPSPAGPRLDSQCL